MSNSAIHVGDYGTNFNLTIEDQDENVVNLNDASGKLITFLKPDKSTMLRSGILPNGGSDGLMKYTTINGDIDSPGIWSVQGHILHPSGAWYTNVQEFRVERNI